MHQWLMFVILATCEAEIGKNPGIVHETPSRKLPEKN
jgi:hypothetical protein